MNSIANEVGSIKPLTEFEIVEVAGGVIPLAVYLVVGVTHGAAIYLLSEYLT